MLCHELERAIHAYLATVAGYLGNVQDVSVESLSGQLEPPSVLIIPGIEPLHFYTGENNAERVFPCVVISSREGEEEGDTGNKFCSATVTVIYQIDDATENPNPLKAIREVSDTIIHFLFRSDLKDQLNEFRNDYLTVIDVMPGRSHERSAEGRSISHEVTIQFIAANTDLLTQTDTQEAALEAVLQ